MTELEREFEKKINWKQRVTDWDTVYSSPIEYVAWLESLVTTLRIDLSVISMASRIQSDLIEDDYNEIERLRSLTAWHTGEPKENGEYVAKYKTNTGFNENVVDVGVVKYDVDFGWLVSQYCHIIAFAYLPQEDA